METETITTANNKYVLVRMSNPQKSQEAIRQRAQPVSVLSTGALSY
jgi:hypothetical protein